ncbi:Extracellular serine protease precursor [Polystyrenella longa]|uniref:Extracellular serine protease n=1 Tax=Polystyrenella longa TaxID=2528007 RepID=A0A518CMI5_9PLAN|nr:autotransporter outer membrane beta-barrel domain-containing protein [Polystyrenella longa]QDU80440.1 Extracellular serine protease precursor [Polystyrenella longa]
MKLTPAYLFFLFSKRIPRTSILIAAGCVGLSGISLNAATFNVTDSATFATAIQNAVDGDVININSNVTLSSAPGHLTADVTVNGNNNTIDGADSYRPFFIESGSVEINNLTIQNGLGKGGNGADGYNGGGGGLGAGGAILVNDIAGLTLDNVNFSNNSAVGGDGGVYDPLIGFIGGGGGGVVGNASGASGGSYGGGDGGQSVGDQDGKDGGYAGGGGGSYYHNNIAGDGGFGGGGGGTTFGSPGTGGYGGANGLSDNGGGGAGFGGAIFVRSGGQLTIKNGSFSGGTVAGGSTGSFGGPGSAEGTGLFLHDVNAVFEIGNGETMTFEDAISGTSNGSLSKTGVGTLILSGTNNYSGGTTVTAGKLQGTTSGLQGDIANNSQVEFNQSTDGTYSGVMSGTGSLSKMGSGTVTLSGNNTYTGTTSINNGTLAISTNDNLGSGNVIFNGGTLKTLQTFDTSRNFSLQGGGGTINTNGFDSTFSGVVSGSGNLNKLGSGTLTLSGTNTYTGTTGINSGTLAISTNDNLGSGNVIFDGGTLKTLQSFDNSRDYSIQAGGGGVDTNGFNSTFSGVISGSGSLNKNGTGTLSLTGNNTYTGDTRVFAGRLAVNGSITSDTTVNSGAELGGNGTITGNLINNGTLATGNSIGALNVIGTHTSNSGSSIEIELQPSANPVAGTDNDHLNVTGNAVINGGNVAVKGGGYINSQTFTNGAEYTFLSASGGVTGTYDSIADDLAFFDAILGYTGTSAFFTLQALETDFAALSQTGNQGSVGQYIDDNSQGATGDFGNIIDQLRFATNGQVNTALSQLDGAVYGSGGQFGVHTTTFMLMNITQQLRSTMNSVNGNGSGYVRTNNYRSPGYTDTLTASPGISLVSYEQSNPSHFFTPVACHCQSALEWRGWVTGYGLGGSAETDGNAAGINYRMGGSTFGIEKDIDQDTRLGFFGGYVGSYIQQDGMNQNLDIDGGNFGTILTHTQGDWYTIALSGLQFDDYDSTRQVNIAGTIFEAEGESEGWQGFLYGEQGLNFVVAPGVLWQPYLGMQYVYARQNSFSETGAPGINLDVAGVDTHSLRGILGSRVALTDITLMDNFNVTPEVRAMWIHEFLEPTSPVNAQFAGVGGAGYSVNGLNLGRDWAVLGTGVSTQLTNHWEVRADYNSQFNDRQVFHLGSGTLTYSW